MGASEVATCALLTFSKAQSSRNCRPTTELFILSFLQLSNANIHVPLNFCYNVIDRIGFGNIYIRLGLSNYLLQLNEQSSQSTTDIILLLYTMGYTITQVTTEQIINIACWYNATFQHYFSTQGAWWLHKITHFQYHSSRKSVFCANEYHFFSNGLRGYVLVQKSQQIWLEYEQHVFTGNCIVLLMVITDG